MSYFARSDELPEWASHVPDTWESNWLKWSTNLFTKRPSEQEQEALPYISNEDIESWTGKLLTGEPKPAEADSRLFQANDVLFNKLRPYLAKVYHANFEGVSSGELLCIRPSQGVDPRFLFYVLASKGFIDTINAETFGAKMPRADWAIVGHQPLPLPPRDTQRRIVEFLDEKTARIDGLIEKKRALLDRLAEKRQALITHAVTKGLDPDAPMKPSGIDWLGDVPAHWELKRLSSFCEFQSGKAHEPFIESDGHYVCVNARFISTNGATAKRCTVNLTPATAGDILMVMSDLPNGRALARSFLVDDRDHYAVNQRVCRIRPRHGSAAFYSYQLDRNPQLLQHDDGKEQTHLSNSSFKLVQLLVPPAVEQQQVVDYLDRANSSIDETTSKVAASANHLEEYRSALITSAVTGQLQELQ